MTILLTALGLLFLCDEQGNHSQNQNFQKVEQNNNDFIEKLRYCQYSGEFIDLDANCTHAKLIITHVV